MSPQAGRLCYLWHENTAYWLELLVDARIVAADKLSPLRQECDELTAIFVTIIKKSSNPLHNS